MKLNKVPWGPEERISQQDFKEPSEKRHLSICSDINITFILQAFLNLYTHTWGDGDQTTNPTANDRPAPPPSVLKTSRDPVPIS